jgi:hypothetical protein
MDSCANPILLQHEEGEEMQEERMRGFNTYGVEEIYKCLYHSTPRDNDPHVTLKPFVSQMPTEAVEILACPHFRATMEDLAGPFLPMPQDFGIGRYLRVLNAVSARVAHLL